MTRRGGLVAVLALAAAIGWAVPANAHTQLVSSSPEAGATVESPASVSLTFSEGLLEIGAQVSILDASGADHASGDPYFPSAATVQVDVEPLAQGAYTAHWRVVAEDGHPIEGTLPFTVVAPAPSPSATPSDPHPASPSAGPSATPTPTGATAAPEDTPRAAPSSESDFRGSLFVMIAAMIGAVVLIAAAVYFSTPKDSLTGSRRRTRSS